jgi:hypothetical protein
MMEGCFQRFSPRLRGEAVAFQMHFEAAEQHVARRHLVDQQVEPVHQQQLGIWRLAGKPDHLFGRHHRGIGDHRRQRQGSLLESLLERRAQTAHADIGLMGKMLPAGGGHADSLLVKTGLIVPPFIPRGNGARHARVCRLLRTKGVCP